MKTDNVGKLRSGRVWLSPEACELAEFRSRVERTTNLAD